jgi:hypothetical protein
MWNTLAHCHLLFTPREYERSCICVLGVEYERSYIRVLGVEYDRSCICVLGASIFASVPTTFRLDFGTVLM